MADEKTAHRAISISPQAMLLLRSACWELGARCANCPDEGGGLPIARDR